MTAPSGKEGSAEATRGSAAAATPPNIPSASRRVHLIARGSAFMSMAPFSQFLVAAQKSGLSAVGTAAVLPGKYPCGFSAQMNSGHSPNELKGRR